MGSDSLYFLYVPHYLTLSSSLPLPLSQAKQGSELQFRDTSPQLSAFLTPQQMSIAKKVETHLFLKYSALALPINEPCELFSFIYDAKLQKVLRCVRVRGEEWRVRGEVCVGEG